jgi:hypothetical protein
MPHAPQFYPDLKGFRPQAPPLALPPESPLLALGSCFAQEMHLRLEGLGLPSRANPMGPVYNPGSLGEILDLLLGITRLESAEVFLHKELWRHPLAHSILSLPERKPYIDQLEAVIQSGKSQLSCAKILVITLGTDQGFFHNNHHRLYSNCHTLPGSSFEKQPLDLREQKALWVSRFQHLQEKHPDLQLVLTLSPVRYTQNSLEENSLSKARLRVFILELLRDLEEEQGLRAYYFPAYEMAMDLLRDYRFYASDQRHLSVMAIDWIFTVFCSWLYSSDGQNYLAAAEKLKNMLEHKVFFPQTSEGQKFVKKKAQALVDFHKAYPWSSLSRK